MQYNWLDLPQWQWNHKIAADFYKSVLIIPSKSIDKKNFKNNLLSVCYPSFKSILEKRFLFNSELKYQKNFLIQLSNSEDKSLNLYELSTQKEPHELLTQIKKMISLIDFESSSVQQIDLSLLSEVEILKIFPLIVTTMSVSLFKFKKYGSKNKPNNLAKNIYFLLPRTIEIDSLSAIAKQEWHMGQANNWIRFLSMRAANDLDPDRYLKEVKSICQDLDLSFKHYTKNDLKKLGAGAFLAVSRACEKEGVGIYEIGYQPKDNSENKHIALVGKGITFDTGGYNIKTGSYMYGMKSDMTGSAIALSYVVLAKKLGFNHAITSYLAVTENLLHPQGYKPDEVVKSLSGKTIEIIDTDAEGRMVLSDTLTLASQNKSITAVIDFATLTGSCIRAIGTRYSGGYCNRKKGISLILKASQKSGERVWPFPITKDFGLCLKSEVADLKQCRSGSGGVDHIEAAYFLSRFIQNKHLWFHVDLSSGENEGGLAHVSTRTTGFGIRFTKELIDLILVGH